MKTNKKKVDVILAIILLSYFMILLDNSIIFTGTVKIAESLQLNQLQLSWVSNAYSLTFGGLLLLGGRAGDLFGRKKMFSIGLIIFGIGSLFVGLSQGAISIILARGFQGIGSAILAPTTLALLMDTYQGEARTRAVAYYGATAGIGASIGLVVGGIFASALSWRDGFFINVPISIVMLLFALKYLHKQEAQKGHMDYLGAITSVVGMVSLVYSIVGERYQLFALILALIFLGLFLYQQGHTQYPMMPLRLFKNRERAGAYLARFLYMGAMLSFWFLTPQIMQTELGFTPLQAGLGFFPLTIVNFVVALQVTKLTKKWGNSKLLLVGVLLTTVGMFLVSWFTPEIGYVLGIAGPMILLGIGQGMSLSPLTVAGIAETLPEDAGAASGVVNMVHQIGGSIGLSIVVAISSLFKTGLVAYHSAMWVTTAFLIGAFLSVLLMILPSEKKRK